MLIKRAGLIIVAGAALTACSSGGGAGPTVTVTVPPSTATSPSSSSASAPATTSAPAPPSPTATSLPGTCESLLSNATVTQALGNVQLAGSDAFVVGVPDTAIGRLSSINCRYGVVGTGAAAKTKIEIGVSLYASAERAEARIDATAGDYMTRGASSDDVAIPAAGSQPALAATYLTGAVGTGYDLPLLVAAADRRTIAVTVDPVAVQAPPAQQAALTLARLAVQRTTA